MAQDRGHIWAQRYHIESASFDHAYVDFRWAGDSNPTRLFEWLGASMNVTVGSPSTTINESAGWGVFTADMSAYAGQQTERLFHLDSDSSVQYTGFAIDDVTVTACEEVVVNPAITLAKTVGTTPGVCAATNAVTVSSGNGCVLLLRGDEHRHRDLRAARSGGRSSRHDPE